MRTALVLAATAVLLAAVESPALAQGSGPPERRTVVLGLRTPAGLLAAASRISNPTSSQYRRFLSLRQYRDRFGASAADVRRVRRYLSAQRGVRRIELSPDRSNVLLVVTPAAGRRLFCASGPAPPNGRLCTPRPLRRVVRLVSAGELFQVVRGRASEEPPRSAGTGDCAGAGGGGTFTPSQLSTAYGVDALHSRGLDGSGIRVVTLSAQEVPTAGFAIWARCFGLRTPAVRQIAMPGATRDTGTAPEETVLDVEALAALAPGLESITPIYVPLDQNFPHSFVVFMLGALDPGRQGGELPDVLSLSDGVCENRFTRAQLRLGRRLLAQAAALGISTLAASGDLGFLGCETPKPGANFPASSAFATSVGGTDLSLGPGNAIASQVVWSTFATDSTQGVGSGGGPSATWPRPRYQQAPGIDSELQSGRPTRLGPDVASLGSFVPGISVYDEGGGGWGIGGGTSTATPLTAAMLALVLQQERAAGRPALGSLPALLYQLARGPGYHSIFYDVTEGTSAPRPSTPVGQTPAGGAAQRGYDLATGLGTLNAAAFADAVAALPAR